MEERLKYLFRQYLGNKCSREELEEFFSYIRASGQDEALRKLIKSVYEEKSQAAASLTYVNELGDLVLTDKAKVNEITLQKKPSRKQPVTGIIVLASLVTIVAITWLLHRTDRGPAAPAVATLTRTITERSEYKYLLLPDSTQVWLNASSSLEFPAHFKEGKREVTLSGEAYFDVKHVEKAPFIIHTGRLSTTVLGTAFNIKAYPDRKNIIVSVSTGKVRVSYDNVAVATLVKGQLVKVGSQADPVVEKKIAPAAVAAWQQGNMSYEDEALEDIVADLERLYNVKIRIDNASILNLKVSTSFRREIGIEQALQVLCRLTDTMLRQADGVWIIQ